MRGITFLQQRETPPNLALCLSKIPTLLVSSSSRISVFTSKEKKSVHHWYLPNSNHLRELSHYRFPEQLIYLLRVNTPWSRLLSMSVRSLPGSLSAISTRLKLMKIETWRWAFQVNRSQIQPPLYHLKHLKHRRNAERINNAYFYI